MFPHCDFGANSLRFRKASWLLELRGGGMDMGGASSAATGDGILEVVRGRFETLLQRISHSLMKDTQAIVAAACLAFLLGPCSRIYCDHLSRFVRNEEMFPRERNDVDGSFATRSTQRRSYEGSTISHVIDTIAWAARLFLLVVFVDLVQIVLVGLGLRIPKSESIKTVFAVGLYLLWGFRRISILKLYLLKKIMVHTDIINNPARLRVINRLTDCGLVVFGFFAFYEVLDVEMGYSAKSILAMFSVGSAVITLATRGIIENLLNGILLSASNRIYEGDFVALHNHADANARKNVEKLGWLETSLRGSDNILYTIPNTELLGSQISNLSRIKTCQVHQTLKLPYSAINKLPQLTKDIKWQIRMACPSIITDGSRPFRCYWINFGPNEKSHLEILVDVHFRISPVSEEYYENRQRCLIAIDTAIRKNDIDEYSGS